MATRFCDDQQSALAGDYKTVRTGEIFRDDAGRAVGRGHDEGPGFEFLTGQRIETVIANIRPAMLVHDHIVGGSGHHRVEGGMTNQPAAFYPEKTSIGHGNDERGAVGKETETRGQAS